MIIKPLSDHVLIEPLRQEEKTKSGILLPETAEKEKPEQGKIIAVGPGKKLEDGKLRPVDVTVGDIVLMDKYSGQEVTIDDAEFVILKNDDMIAIIEQ